MNSMAGDKKSNTYAMKKKTNASVGSRMSKASMRDTKANKSKQQKSVFTQKEEEYYPDNLNVKHFDQLTRIHSMLAMISDKAENQILLMLDAKLFLVKIIEVSFYNLNQIEESRAMNALEQGLPGGTDGTANKNVKTFVMPQTLESWVEFEFPKELKDKIEGNEESNIICKFAFEYPELSFWYMDRIVTILEKYGMHIHCVPIYSLMRLFSSHILCNDFLSLSVELKYAICLSSLGSEVKCQKILSEILPKIVLDESNKKHYMINLERISNRDVDLNNNGNGKTGTSKQRNAFVVGEILPDAAWVKIARELIYFGEFYKARILLEEAKKHALFLRDMEKCGEIELLFGRIFYMEGKYSESLGCLMAGHKMIKHLMMWEEAIRYFPKKLKIKNRYTYATLKKLRKFDDIRSFLDKILLT